NQASRGPSPSSPNPTGACASVRSESSGARPTTQDRITRLNELTPSARVKESFARTGENFMAALTKNIFQGFISTHEPLARKHHPESVSPARRLPPRPPDEGSVRCSIRPRATSHRQRAPSHRRANPSD